MSRVVERLRNRATKAWVLELFEVWLCKRQRTWQAEEKLILLSNRWWRSKLLAIAQTWRDLCSLKISHRTRVQQAHRTGSLRVLGCFFGMIAVEAARSAERETQAMMTVRRRVMMWGWMNLHINHWSCRQKSVLELRASRRRLHTLFCEWRKTTDSERNTLATAVAVSRTRRTGLFFAGWRKIGQSVMLYRQHRQHSLFRLWQEQVQRQLRESREGGEILLFFRARELWDSIHQLFIIWRRAVRLRRAEDTLQAKAHFHFGRGTIRSIVKHWRSTACATKQRLQFGAWALHVFDLLRKSKAVMAWGRRTDLIACFKKSARRRQKRAQARILHSCVLEWWSLAAGSRAVSHALVAKQALDATAHCRSLLKETLQGWRAVIREVQLRSLRCERLHSRIHRRKQATAFGEWDDVVEETMRRESSAKCLGDRPDLMRAWCALIGVVSAARRIRLGSRLNLLWHMLVEKSLSNSEQKNGTSARRRVSLFTMRRKRAIGTTTRERRSGCVRCVLVCWSRQTEGTRKGRAMDTTSTRERELKTVLIVSFVPWRGCRER